MNNNDPVLCNLLFSGPYFDFGPDLFQGHKPAHVFTIRIVGSWVRLRGPVIQANGRLTFEDDLRSGGLLCFISMNASVRTELADSMVTPGEPGGD